MTVVIFIPLILLTIICNMAGGKIEYISTLRRNAEAEFSEIVADVYHNVAVVKLSRSWQAISKNLEDSNTLLKKISIKGKLLSEFVSYLSEISYYISVLIILIASLYSADGFDLGKYTLFEYSLSLVNATFMAYSFAIIERGNTEASLKKIKSVGEFVNLKCSNSTKPLKIEKKELCGSVLRFVGYRHKLETNDLFQFEIKLGCINVMTGKVATGKTTLLKSMLGLTYHNGYVEFQGKRFRDLSEMEQLISVGYAPQKIHLFRMPLKDNIEMWRGSEANEYLKTIQEVELEEDFENFSVDAISNIGKGGALLSGGQKARVALARMLFANKDIYVVDDIFTEIDIQTFSRIWDNMLEKKNKGKTFIIVSNNEEIINRADHVITLQ